MDYYNTILQQKTNNKYRFKTEEEFINEFGTYWTNVVAYNWNECMNIYFGSNFDYNNKKSEYQSFWSISEDMLILNKNIKPDYKSKKLVYESKDNSIECIIFKISENGETFEELQHIGFENGYYWMNNCDIIREYSGAKLIIFRNYDKIKKIMWSDDNFNDNNDKIIKYHAEFFHIDINSIVVLDTTKQLKSMLKYGKKYPDYNTPNKLIYEKSNNKTYHFKTEQEFIDDYGVEWRNRSHYWNYLFTNSMVYFFGKKIDFDKIEYCLDDNGDIDSTKLNSDDCVCELFNERGVSFFITPEMIKVDYKKPNYGSKELVYEANNSKEKANEIIVKINTEEEFKILTDIYKQEFKEKYIGDCYYFPCFWFIMLNGKNLSIYSNDEVNNFGLFSENAFNKPILTGTYEYIFDFNNENDILKVKRILKSKSLQNISPDYNTPKELIYEKTNYNQPTYRIKTEKEFIEEYGENWMDVSDGWNYCFSRWMYHILGYEVNDEIKSILDDDGNIDYEKTPTDYLFRYKDNDNNFWFITKEMIKKINKPNYNSKKLIYEKLEYKYYNEIIYTPTNFKYRFKTEEEFLKEYGEDWKYDINSCWDDNGEMDYLFGTDFKTESTDINLYNSYNIITDYDDQWYISTDMIKENKKNKPDYNTPKELVYETKMLRFSNFK